MSNIRITSIHHQLDGWDLIDEISINSNKDDLHKKIQKAKEHIKNLELKSSDRKTHGGKRYRDRKHSNEEEIRRATFRVEELYKLIAASYVNL